MQCTYSFAQVNANEGVLAQSNYVFIYRASVLGKAALVGYLYWIVNHYHDGTANRDDAFVES